MKKKILLLTLAIPVMLCQNALAQTASRLIGVAHWANNGATFTPIDSTSYSYSGNRGGDLKSTLKYDNSYTWTFDTAYENSYYYIQTFDANNNITSKITEFWNGSSWQLLSNTLYTYNSSNQMTTMILQNWNGSAWAPVAQDVYSYNVAGKLVSDLYQQWNTLSSAFVNTTLKTYYYDVSGNKINETDQNYISGTPIYTNQYAYTYSASNQLLTSTYSNWNGTGWTPVNRTTNTIDTSGNKTTVLFEVYDNTTSAWVNSTMDNYSMFSSDHNPMMDVHQIWIDTGAGSWQNSIQYTYTYNSFGQLTSSTGESWNIVGVFEFALGDPMVNYYYQTYSPVTAVKNVTATAGDAKVYPVPAEGTLNVDLTWNEAQTAEITIYNAQGSVVRQWSTPNTAQFHSTVSVEGMSAGIYFLKINGTQGQIVKQLVVAH